MAEKEKVDLELLKFHWEKWREEANRFWKHLAFGTIALLAISMYQLDVLQFNFTFAKIASGANNVIIKRWLMCPVSIWLWISILFSLVDFLRHRVPEEFERFIHNNSYPVPGTKRRLDLKVVDRVLYLIVVLLYLAILGGWVVYCFLKVWT